MATGTIKVSPSMLELMLWGSLQARITDIKLDEQGHIAVTVDGPDVPVTEPGQLLVVMNTVSRDTHFEPSRF